MAYCSQLCLTCKHKKEQCYAAPNSTCDKYESEKEKNMVINNVKAVMK